MEKAVLDTEDASAAASFEPRRAVRAEAHSSVSLSWHARIHSLTTAARRLARIERSLANRGRGAAAAPFVASLRPIVDEVARECANPPDRIRAGTRLASAYLAALGDLIRAYAATEPRLDDETLTELDWIAQQIRLEYLRVLLAARLNEPPRASIRSRIGATPEL